MTEFSYFFFPVKSNRMEWVNKLFMSHGFRVEVVDYDKVACEEPDFGHYKNILFVAEHLRFSDDQVRQLAPRFYLFYFLKSLQCLIIV